MGPRSKVFLLAGLLLAVLAGLWLFSPTGLYLVETQVRTIAPSSPAASGSISYVDLRPGAPARRYQTLFGAPSLTTLQGVAETENVSPAGRLPRLTATDPLTDQVVPSVLPPAAPLLAATAATVGLDLEVHGPRLLGTHPASPLAGRIIDGHAITAIEVPDPSGGAPLVFPTPDSARILDVLASLDPGTDLTLVTETRSHTVALPASGALGLILADYMVPRDLPDLELPSEVSNPSAGLATALHLAALISETDFLGGRNILAAARISATGAVLPLDNPELRAGALRRSSGIDLLVVHSSQVGHFEDRGVEVVAADSLSDLIATLIDSASG